MAYGLGVLKGMLLTLQHVFRPPITLNYPEFQREVPIRARTNLLWFEERCTGCSTCAQACPDGCILVETAPRADGTLDIGPVPGQFQSEIVSNESGPADQGDSPAAQPMQRMVDKGDCGIVLIGHGCASRRI